MLQFKAYNLDDQQDDSDLPPIPDDYEAIPLIEAINGSINSNKDNIPSSNACEFTEYFLLKKNRLIFRLLF